MTTDTLTVTVVPYTEFVGALEEQYPAEAIELRDVIDGDHTYGDADMTLISRDTVLLRAQEASDNLLFRAAVEQLLTDVDYVDLEY